MAPQPRPASELLRRPVARRAWRCRTAYCDLVDDWLPRAVPEASSGAGRASRWWRSAATGAAELAPQSDLDVLLLHDGRQGHRRHRRAHLVPDLGRGPEARPRGAHRQGGLALAADDLDTATSLRHDPPPRRRPGAHRRPRRRRALALWRKRAEAVARRARASGSTIRQEAAGEVAFLLEPDLKEGRGGLRDVHAIRWAEQAQAGDARRATTQTLAARPTTCCSRRGSSCTAAPAGPATGCCSRSRTPWPTALGYADADDLMAAVSAAARTIAWTSDEVWERVDSSLKGPLGWRMSRDRDAGRRRRAARRRVVHHAPTPTRPPTRCSCCGSRWPRPQADARIDRALARPAGRRVAPTARSRGRRGPATCSPTCCSPGDRPST